MAGYIHIFRTELATGTYGSSITEYQLTYTSGRNSWARTFDGEGLEEFLVHDVGLAPEDAATILDRARLQGNVTVADINIPESEAGALGLQQMPVD